MAKRFLLFFMAVMTASLLLAGCGSDGSDGKDGINGTNGVNGTNATAEKVKNAESCSVCHNDIDQIHKMDQKNTWDGKITGVDFTGGQAVITFQVYQAADPTKPISGIDFASSTGLKNPYILIGYKDPTTGWHGFGGLHLSFTANATTVETATPGTYTATINTASYDPTDAAYKDVPNRFGLVITTTGANHVDLSYDVVPSTGATPAGVDLVTKASCLKCHSGEYATIMHDVDNGKLCVLCHNQNMSAYGMTFTSHPEMVAPNLVHGVHGSGTDMINGGNGYVTNWGTGSGNVKFAYPQSMSNCRTCHETQTEWDTVSADANFKASTCQTCHGGTGSAFSWDNFTFPSTNIKNIHASMTESANCQTCHNSTANAIAKSFAKIHDGLDKAKDLGKDIAYDNLDVTYDTANNKLTIKWGAHKISDATYKYNVLNTADATLPLFLGDAAERNNASEGAQILVGLYGSGSRDVVSYAWLHKSDILANTTYAGGVATTVLSLNNYAATKSSVISGSKVVKGIVALTGIPFIGGNNAKIKSVHKEFNIDGTAAVAREQVANNAKCDSCHDTIMMHYNSTHGATNAGDTVICSVCHNKASGSVHFKNQPRALGGFLHALHAKQPMDANTESDVEYPANLSACVTCHDTGKYDVPNQTTSLPAVISTNGSTVTGPAAAACGGCHKAQADAGDIASFNAHTTIFGYSVTTVEMAFADVVEKVMSFFN